MISPDFAFCHEVEMEKWLGRTACGEKYAPAGTLRCHLNLGMQANGNNRSHGVHIEGRAILPGNTEIHIGDRLRRGGQIWQVVRVTPAWDLCGNRNHIEVELA